MLTYSPYTAPSRLAAALSLAAVCAGAALPLERHAAAAGVPLPFAAALPTQPPPLSPPHAPTLPPISGIARLDSNRLIAVHDFKAKDPSPRLSVITPATDDAPLTIEPLKLDVSPHSPPNDLEAICPVGDDAAEYFLLESGGLKSDGSPTPRRLFRVRIDPAASPLSCILVGDPVDLRPASDSLTNVESLAALPMNGGDYRLILADRELRLAPQNSPASPAASLMLYCIDLNPGSAPEPMKRWAAVALPGDFGPHWRACADIALQWYPVNWAYCDPVAGMSGSVYVSATFDPGDEGPFESRIYRIGAFQAGAFKADPALATQAAVPPVSIAGFKVEGLLIDSPTPAHQLASPSAAGSAPSDATMLLACDNEAFGGCLSRAPLPQR